jgi:restriction system protein
MAIPNYESLMQPLLDRLGDGQVRLIKDVVAELADHHGLSPEERAQLLPSGGTLTFASRVGWAKTYLKKAGLLTQPKRGYVQITDAGRLALRDDAGHINTKYLERFESFQAFRAAGKDSLVSNGFEIQPIVSLQAELTPDEIMETAHTRSVAALADEVLDRVKSCPPEFFERLVVRLLIEMGYGGSKAEAGRAVGKSGDGGIDGIINEDRLGLDAIYLQAKRWEGVVGRPEIMKFVGALAGQRAIKGVFITTSWFTQEAKDYAASSQYKVVLIDGARLSDLMIEHNLGVSVVASYHLKRVDSDFFADE